MQIYLLLLMLPNYLSLIINMKYIFPHQSKTLIESIPREIHVLGVGKLENVHHGRRKTSMNVTVVF
jgi:hypothetical protein